MSDANLVLARNAIAAFASYFRDADVWQILNLDVQEFRDLGDRVLVV
jgi:hypothetical protein